MIELLVRTLTFLRRLVGAALISFSLMFILGGFSIFVLSMFFPEICYSSGLLIFAVIFLVLFLFLSASVIVYYTNPAFWGKVRTAHENRADNIYTLLPNLCFVVELVDCVTTS